MPTEITGDEPIMVFNVRENPYGNTLYGLTIRQEFAARAMQSILRNIDFFKAILQSRKSSEVPAIYDWVATEACSMADALIEELNKEK